MESDRTVFWFSVCPAGCLLVYVLFPSFAFCHHSLKLQACVSRMCVSWCDLVYQEIITRLCLGTPAVPKLKAAHLLKLKEKDKLIHIETLKSESWNLFSSAPVKMFSVPTEVKLLQTTPQLLLVYAFDSSAGYFATRATWKCYSCLFFRNEV